MSEAPSWLTEETITAAKLAARKSNDAEELKVQQAGANEVAAPGWLDGIVPIKKSVNFEAKSSEASKKEASSAVAADDLTGDIDEHAKKDMNNWNLVLRVLYCCAAMLLIVSALLGLLGNTDIGITFICFYVVAFSSVLCCTEIALNFIARFVAVNFGFMYTVFGRFVFCILVGFQAFSISLLGKCAMAFLYAVMLFHMYLFYKFPRFGEFVRSTHYGRLEQARAKRNSSSNV